MDREENQKEDSEKTNKIMYLLKPKRTVCPSN